MLYALLSIYLLTPKTWKTEKIIKVYTKMCTFLVYSLPLPHDHHHHLYEIGQHNDKKKFWNLVFYCFDLIPKCLNCQENNWSL